MVFSISGGGGGFLYAVGITILITVGAIVVYVLGTATRQVKDDVVREEGDDPDLLS